MTVFEDDSLLDALSALVALRHVDALDGLSAAFALLASSRSALTTAQRSVLFAFVAVAHKQASDSWDQEIGDDLFDDEAWPRAAELLRRCAKSIV
jgi:hypothetical protein